MNRTRRFSRLGALVVALFFAHSIHADTYTDIVTKSVEALLQRVEPALEFRFNSPKGGVVIGDALSLGAVEFLLDARLFETDRGQCFAGLLQYPKLHRYTLAHYSETGVSERPKLTPVIFAITLASTGPETVSRPLDNESMTVFAKDLLVGDLLGEGSVQLQFTRQSYRAYADPEELVSVTFLEIVNVPSLQKRAELVTARSVRGEGYIEKDEFIARRARVIPRSGNEPAALLLHSDALGAKRYPLTPNDMQVGPPENPWTRDPERVASRKAVAEPRNLILHIVDGDGNPVSSATITGEQRRPGLDLTTKSEPVSLKSDSNGNAIVEVSKTDIVLQVNAEGFYKKTLHFERTEVPSRELEVVLEREMPRVTLRKSEGWGMSYKWDTDSSTYEIGLRFGKDERLDGGGAWTEERQEADIWFIISRTEKIELSETVNVSNDNKWSVSAKGVGGWQVQAAPPSVGLGDNRLKEAPETGYSEESQFSGANHYFFVFHPEGGLYGRLERVGFSDSSKLGEVKRGLTLNYAVQAENSGTRSLNG